MSRLNSHAPSSLWPDGNASRADSNEVTTLDILNIYTGSKVVMTIVIADETHAHAFTINRYQRSGNRADVAPKVKSLSLERIDIGNLRTKEVDAHTFRGSACTIHERCMGHLLSSSRSSLLLPKWCISDDPEMMDRRSRATLAAMSGTMCPRVYSEELRSTLMGKRGLMRHKLLGSKPITSMRGVATCVWSINPHVVLIPHRWMKDVKVPYRKRGRNNTVSPSFSFRSAVNGDHAVLLRCPVVSDSSVQPVTIVGWNNLSIGVHPEMCAPLNLDYDGDEVHVTIVSSVEAKGELQQSIEVSTLGKFSNNNVATALADTNCLPHDNDADFMVGTTLCMSELDSYVYNSAIAKISKCKESSRGAFLATCKIKTLGPELSILDQWSNAMHQMTVSNLSVSMGHTFSRQLSIAAMTVVTDPEQPRPYWSPETNSPMCVPTLSRFNDHVYGFPGVRLATRLAGAMTQGYLDMAKGAASSVNDALLASMVSKSTEYCYLVGVRGEELRMVTALRRSVGPHLEDGSTVLASTDPRYVLKHIGNANAPRSCVTMLEITCRRLGVTYDEDEIVHLASLIFHSICSVGHAEITSTSPGVFLSGTSCDRLASALCESIYVLDRVDLRKSDSRGMNTSECGYPYCALSVGNMCRLNAVSRFRPT